METTQSIAQQEWGADFFGTLNELPPEPVTGIGHILEAMGTLPTFHDARRWVLGNLGMAPGSALLEAGCGTGVALTEILTVVGSSGRVQGIDPTHAFVEEARHRAEQHGASNARYDIGDIRSIASAAGEFDAAFCDKVLIHAGPPRAALGEMARVTRPGGRIGAIEWFPSFILSATRPEAADAFNAIFTKATYDYPVSANLARHFHAAGLRDVQTEAFLAHTSSLDAHPFWRAFIVHQMPMFVHAGLIGEGITQTFLADLEELEARGEFSASFVVQAAVGVVPA